jgi:lycopene cyclase domain-containing protein
MATYLILNMCILAIVLVLLRQRVSKPSTVRLVTLGLLLVLTAIFDSLIISLGVVGYNPDKLLGLYIGSAPVEDFFYAIVASILIPTVWNKLGNTHD